MTCQRSRIKIVIPLLMFIHVSCCRLFYWLSDDNTNNRRKRSIGNSRVEKVFVNGTGRQVVLDSLHEPTALALFPEGERVIQLNKYHSLRCIYVFSSCFCLIYQNNVRVYRLYMKKAHIARHGYVIILFIKKCNESPYNGTGYIVRRRKYNLLHYTPGYIIKESRTIVLDTDSLTLFSSTKIQESQISDWHGTLGSDADKWGNRAHSSVSPD